MQTVSPPHTATRTTHAANTRQPQSWHAEAARPAPSGRRADRTRTSVATGIDRRHRRGRVGALRGRHTATTY
eukprot:1413996-Prymnesium_polylepis.1